MWLGPQSAECLRRRSVCILEAKKLMQDICGWDLSGLSVCLGEAFTLSIIRASTVHENNHM